MTEQTNDQTPDTIEDTTAEKQPQHLEDHDVDEQADTPDEDPRPANKEARYRLRLRETEAELEATRERLHAVEVDYLTLYAGRRFQDPEDLARFLDPATLRGEDGRLDLAKATNAVDELLKERTYLQKQPRRDFPQERRGERISLTASGEVRKHDPFGLRGDRDSGATWADALHVGTRREQDRPDVTERARAPKARMLE